MSIEKTEMDLLRITSTTLTVTHGILLRVIPVIIQIEFIHFRHTVTDEPILELYHVNSSPLGFSIVAIANFDFPCIERIQQ